MLIRTALQKLAWRTA